MRSDKTRPRLGLPETRHAPNPRRKPVRGSGVRERRQTKSWATASPEKVLPAIPENALRAESCAGKALLPATAKTEPHRKQQPDAGIASGGMSAPPDLSRKSKSQAGVRISKLMAERGLCSRREADVYIERGWVYVDGRQVNRLGSRAHPSARIFLDKAAKIAQRRQVTILLNKPLGYVSGQPEPGCIPAVTLIRPENQCLLSVGESFSPLHLKGLAPAGRLDVNSTGLLVLTQDGRIARQLVGEASCIEKEYLVRVEGALGEAGLALLRHGLSLDGKPLKPAKVELINADQLRFVLNEGRKRQIRRMCELVGLRVVGLKRVRIGKVRLGSLPLGQWRYLSENELF